MTENTETGCMAAIGLALALPAIVALRGWVLSVMWSWFMVPIGVAEIGVAHACGVSTIVAMLTYRKHKDDDDTDHARRNLALAALVPLFLLGFAWVYHSLMGG